VTTHSLELFHGTVDRYTGNFSAYWRQKAERLVVQRRTYEKQQDEIAKAEEFIRRNHYGEKHAQAEDRRKKLERLERVDPPREITAPAMGFPPADRSGDIVVRAERLAKSYDRPLFDNVGFDILRGQRWGILGPNGSGKTTLLRCLLGLEQPDAGSARLGQGVAVGYFDQHLSQFDEDDDAVDAVRPPHKEFDLQKRRNLLARFGLTGDTALQRIGSLSGGERCRAALARLAANDANFLVLDEPTNHLDLWARDALERSLREFDGTVLFVSHDRYFVNRVADHLLVVEPGRIRVVEGNYDAYLLLVRSAPQAAPAPQADARPKPERREPADSAALPRKRKFPYRKTADIEAEIFERESRIEELHGLLALPETHRDGERVRQFKAEILQQQETLESLYAHWEEATELNW
jgi:ATP-binding cassette subfamily F protein 3